MTCGGGSIMGQYFRIVNLDKKEWIEPSTWKLWEICANNDIRMLGYLLATNNPDGTSVIKHFTDPEKAKRKYGESFKILYYDEKYKMGFGVPKCEYFGRWCGDRIAIVGDYADQATNAKGLPTFHELEQNPEWKNITNEVAEEFNVFIEDVNLMVGTVHYINPDMVMSEKSVCVSPKIEVKRQP